MKYNWIKDSGTIKSDLVNEIVKKINVKNAKYIAMMTDKFTSGTNLSEDIFNGIKDRLLEIRVFCEEYELLITRGYLGEDFTWRIAADYYEENGQKKTVDNFIEEEHFIDINEEYSGEKLENGNLGIMSIVGGRYELPIESERKVKIRNYFTYDENGIAKVVDFRICSFI